MRKHLLKYTTLSAMAMTLAFGTTAYAKDFASWDKDADSLQALKAYVEDVTDENSENFIPVEDRIVVSDMDGTLYGEKAPIYVEWEMYAYRVLDDPNFQATDEEKEIGKRIREAEETGEIPEDLEMLHAYANAEVFAGMTLPEYKEYAQEFLKRPAGNFKNLTYADAWYNPMVEVVDYLQENDFTVYICSGTDRFLCRTLAEDHVNIPDEHVIGMDVFLEASGQQDTDGLDYEYTKKDEVIRSDELIIKNVKANKVSQISQEIGRQPVLSLGNSSGDTSMAMYVTQNNPYKSMAFMVVADDNERENGDPEKAAQLKEKWDANGWTSISMKDDWKTIYGEDVTLE